MGRAPERVRGIAGRAWWQKHSQTHPLPVGSGSRRAARDRGAGRGCGKLCEGAAEKSRELKARPFSRTLLLLL